MVNVSLKAKPSRLADPSDASFGRLFGFQHTVPTKLQSGKLSLCNGNRSRLLMIRHMVGSRRYLPINSAPPP